ncbi:hypothetical protein [Paludisphaera soli]|uniref:hypothetical protein n=1 Tax=Paludisphaera soli TaxID=2712865 RepID=UPI0013EAA7DF|nr:hypothetical protein [Paludisphaera soli]
MTAAIGGAWLYDVIGRPRAFGSFVFIPTPMEIEEPCGMVEFFLDDRIAEDRPAAFDGLDAPNWVALWARSRIPAAFGCWPALAYDQLDFHERIFVEGTTTRLVDATFLAVGGRGDRGFFQAYPFALTDVAGHEDGFGDPDYDWLNCCDGGTLRKVGLQFGAAVTDRDVRARIAADFWSLLLDEPGDLRGFSYWYTDDACDYVVFRKAGCERGAFYDVAAYQAGYDSPELDEWDDHLGDPTREGEAECEECGGSGEESFCPAGGPCPACDGRGR